MKKVIYTLLIAFSSAILFTACTEEQITPSIDNTTEGPDFADQVKK